ncbi:ankyrin repeat-containing domain protein [Aspergillus granulosus]|uniref:Ankyrin repeat-containing domain protein n=1 Tax=Aspergillus granulosus TaxID=176169 RepID=A0ABR4HCA6_9EURO
MIDNSGMTALHHASTEGHSELIKALLDAGANIRARTRHKTYTPLLTAAQFGRSTAVQVLLAHGADVNDLNAEKWSALVEAANHNYVEIARIVLTHGANVDVPSENFEPDRTRVTAVTPLMRAAGNGHLLLLGILLDYGADVALKDSRGYTALAFAVKEMQENTARALLERGADIKGLSALGERSNWLSRKLEEEFSV